MKLVPATTPVVPIDQDLIEGLEALLDLARNGEIQGIAYATIRSDGVGSYQSMGTGWRGAGVDNNCHIIVGGVALLSARIIQEMRMM